MTSATEKKPRRGRPESAPVDRDDQLGTIKAVAAHMQVSKTWLCGVKRRYLELARQKAAGQLTEELPQAPVAGGKTCAAWIREFIRHPINAGFVPTRGYKKVRPSRRPSRAASTSGRSDSPPHPHAQ